MRFRVQVFVGLMIGLVVVGFFLAGVGELRHRASLQTCQNNLRQIGIALHNYRDFKDTFPAATYPHPDLPPERRLSWMIEIDPYVHARMDPDWKPNRKEPWDSEANLRLVRRGRMPWYVCPAAPSETDPHGLALTHYVGITGVGADAGTLPKWHPRGGVFNFDRGITWAELKDGVETVVMIETRADNGPWSAGGRPTARPVLLDGPPPVGHGGQFGGLHRGGANLMYADTHLLFVSETVSPEVLAAKVTIAGDDVPWPWPE